MRRLGFAFFLVGAAAAGTEAIASAQEGRSPAAYSHDGELKIEGNFVRVTVGSVSRLVDPGCGARAALRSGSKVWVACGADGVIQLDLSDPNTPRREGTMRVDGDATGLFFHDGTVWVEISHVDARPVRVDSQNAPAGAALPSSINPLQTLPVPGAAAATAGPAPAPGPTPASGPAPASGPTPAPAPAPASASAPAPPPAAPPTAASSLSSLQPSESATKGAYKEGGSLMAPTRRGNIWELALVTEGFIALGASGGGLLGSSSVAYRLNAPLVLRASINPFGVAGSSSTTSSQPLSPAFAPPGPTNTSGGAVTTFAANFLVGLDTEFVELGIGLGGATVNHNESQSNGGPSFGAPTTSAVSIVEAARFGAHDGLEFDMESSAIAVNGQFDLGYFVANFRIPLSRQSTLILRGGGGDVGFAYGGLGVRVLVRGDGGKGTLALSGFVGGAGINNSLCSTNPDPPFTTSCNNTDLKGPSVGFGVDYKL